jgi:hypothetical protein
VAYVRAEYSTYRVREPYDDGWDNGDYSGTFEGIRVCERLAWDAVETNLTGIVYVPYVTYHTGSTFGSEYRAKALAVFASREEAEEFLEEARMGTGYSFEYKGETYYRDWVGYFEFLESLSYEGVIV